MRFILQNPGWVWRKFRVRGTSIRWVICGPGRVICGRDAPNCILQHTRSYAGPPISQMSRIYDFQAVGRQEASKTAHFWCIFGTYDFSQRPAFGRPQPGQGSLFTSEGARVLPSTSVVRGCCPLLCISVFTDHRILPGSSFTPLFALMYAQARARAG